jgi:hypothetical protein
VDNAAITLLCIFHRIALVSDNSAIGVCVACCKIKNSHKGFHTICVLIAQLMVVLRKEGSYKKIICQYDYGYTAAPDELCNVKLVGFIKDTYKHGEKHTTPPLLLQHKNTR